MASWSPAPKQHYPLSDFIIFGVTSLASTCSRCSFLFPFTHDILQLDRTDSPQGLLPRAVVSSVLEDPVQALAGGTEARGDPPSLSQGLAGKC